MTCRRCGHERDAHSDSFGCVVRESDGDCECPAYVEMKKEAI